MIQLTLKGDCDPRALETGNLSLGFNEISLLFNIGPFEGGGDCLIVNADGKLISINSNDLIHDLSAYVIRDS